MTSGSWLEWRREKREGTIYRSNVLFNVSSISKKKRPTFCLNRNRLIGSENRQRFSFFFFFFLFRHRSIHHPNPFPFSVLIIDAVSIVLSYFSISSSAKISTFRSDSALFPALERKEGRSEQHNKGERQREREVYTFERSESDAVRQIWRIACASNWRTSTCRSALLPLLSSSRPQYTFCSNTERVIGAWKSHPEETLSARIVGEKSAWKKSVRMSHGTQEECLGRKP